MLIKIIITLMLVSFYCFPSVLQLTPDNVLNLRGEINETSIGSLQMELAALVEKRGNRNYPLYIAIDSGGGAIDAGLAFIEYAKTVSNLHTITIFGASMASGIQQALPGKRYVLGTSITMFHRASGGFQGQFNDGEVESRLNMAKDIVNILEQSNASRMKMSMVDYKAAVVNEYWIVGATANIAKHAADEMVSISCSNTLISSGKLQTFNVFMFTITVRFSNCPLFRSGTIMPGSEDAYSKNKSAFQRKMTGVYYLQSNLSN